MMQVLKSLWFIFLLSLFCFPLAAQTPGPNQTGDWRNIKNGSIIPDEGYSDHPLIAIISRDKGRTWFAPLIFHPCANIHTMCRFH